MMSLSSNHYRTSNSAQYPLNREALVNLNQQLDDVGVVGGSEGVGIIKDRFIERYPVSQILGLHRNKISAIYPCMRKNLTGDVSHRIHEDDHPWQFLPQSA